MEAIISSVVAALVAGATAATRETASQVVKDSYASLKRLVVDALSGRSGAVQAVEEDPESEPAQTNLLLALARAKLADAQELIESAQKLEGHMLGGSPQHNGQYIQIDAIKAKLKIVVEKLITDGHIVIGPIESEDQVVIRNLRAESQGAVANEAIKKK